jgi:Domain of unknown function (DUF4082)
VPSARTHARSEPGRLPRSARLRVLLVVAAAVGALVVGLVSSLGNRPASALNGVRAVSLFNDATVPRIVRDPDDRAVELGVRVRFSRPGEISGIKFYRSSDNTGPHLGHVWTARGRRLAEVSFPESGPAGWQVAPLTRPVRVAAGSEYVISYFAPKGAYSADPGFFSTPLTKPEFTAPAGRNGVYAYGSSSFPTKTWRSANYYVDLLFVPNGGPASPASPTRSAVPPSIPASPPPTVSPSGPPAGTLQPPPTATTTPPVPPTSASGSTAPSSPTFFPGQASTGISSTPARTVVRGDYHATKAGAVVKDLTVYGTLYVEADDVTVQNVEVVCSKSWWIIRDQGRRTTIQDSTLTVDRSNSSNYCQYGIAGGDGVRILRNDISYTPDGLIFNGDSADVRDNWVHDQVAYPGKEDHVDGAQLNGGGPGPYVFVHNHFSVPEQQTGALSLFADFGPIRNVTVQGNLFDGGGYSFYGGTDSATNVRVTDNSFGTTFFSHGGYFGPVAHFNGKGSGNVWTGNRWLSTGAAVNP